MLPTLFSTPIVLLLAGAVPGERTLNAQYTVTNIGGGLGVFVDEKVIIGGVSDGAAGTRWMAERVRHDRNWCGARDAEGKCRAIDRQVHEWIDGATCGAVATALSELWALRPAKFLAPGDFTVASDSSIVTIQGNTIQAGQYTQTSVSQAAGDYARWWHNASNRWKPCWQASPPVVEGQPLAASLSPAAQPPG